MPSTWHPTGKKPAAPRIVQRRRGALTSTWRPTGKKPAAPPVVQAIRPPGV